MSNNYIQKIQNLHTLQKLQELNLSHNCVVSLEGLSSLEHLARLNVSFNEIKIIPEWFGEKMNSLQVLNMRSNSIKKVWTIYKINQSNVRN